MMALEATMMVRGDGTGSVARWVAPAAVVAGVLWCVQGAIWVFAPKVQEATPPYRVIDRPVFAAVWLSVVGALLCSAAALQGLGENRSEASGMAGRAGRLIAATAVVLAAIAGVAAILAAVGVAEEAALFVLPLALNGGGLALLVDAVLVGSVEARGGVLPRRSRYLPLVLAIMTLLTLGAIAASGTQATVGLVLAVVIVTITGVAWLALGRALRTTRTQAR
jgi:hypothetical protein